MADKELEPVIKKDALESEVSQNQGIINNLMLPEDANDKELTLALEKLNLSVIELRKSFEASTAKRIFQSNVSHIRNRKRLPNKPSQEKFVANNNRFSTSTIKERLKEEKSSKETLLRDVKKEPFKDKNKPLNKVLSASEPKNRRALEVASKNKLNVDEGQKSLGNASKVQKNAVEELREKKNEKIKEEEGKTLSNIPEKLTEGFNKLKEISSEASDSKIAEDISESNVFTSSAKEIAEKFQSASEVIKRINTKIGEKKPRDKADNAGIKSKDNDKSLAGVNSATSMRKRDSKGRFISKNEQEQTKLLESNLRTSQVLNQKQITQNAEIKDLNKEQSKENKEIIEAIENSSSNNEGSGFIGKISSLLGKGGGKLGKLGKIGGALGAIIPGAGLLAGGGNLLEAANKATGNIFNTKSGDIIKNASSNTGIFSKTNTIGKFAGKAGGRLLKSLPLVGGVISAVDAADTLINPESVTGQKENTTRDRIQAAAGTFGSNLSFGLVDPKTIFQGLDFIGDNIFQADSSTVSQSENSTKVDKTKMKETIFQMEKLIESQKGHTKVIEKQAIYNNKTQNKTSQIKLSFLDEYSYSGRDQSLEKIRNS